MKKHSNYFIKTRQSTLLGKFYKMQQRIQKKINSGDFVQLNFRKKRQLLARLKRYALSLEQRGFNLKSAVTGTALALALSFGGTATAQVNFNLQADADNPFNGQTIPYATIPTFVDIDGDGDMDCFTGDYGGGTSFYKNVGSSTEADFELQTDANSPTGTINSGYVMVPAFVDMDGDGDMDLVLGDYNTPPRYFENTGTSTEANFEEQLGANNPLVDIPSAYIYLPEFADLDDDGDMDLLLGEYYGAVSYYKNEGTPTAPDFVLQSGADSPIPTIANEFLSDPSLGDFDGDGDLDMLLGTEELGILYYENTGTSTEPSFVELTGANNPLSANTVNIEYSFPAAVDIDDDGDMDLFVGEYSYGDAQIYYFKNEPPALAFPELADICLEGEIILELGGAVPFGGVYSGNGVMDFGDGMGFSFDPSAAGVGMHTITYTVNGEMVTSSIEVFAIPAVAMDVDDELLVNPGDLPTGIDVNAMPVGGVFTDINGDITDDGNGMTFSLGTAPDFDNVNTLTYTFTDDNGCMNSISEDFQFIDQTVSVAELAELGVEIYPNPTAGQLRLTSNQHSIDNLAIFDMNGRLMLDIPAPNATIDLGSFANGLYVLRLSVNNQIMNTTIIKE